MARARLARSSRDFLAAQPTEQDITAFRGQFNLEVGGTSTHSAVLVKSQNYSSMISDPLQRLAVLSAIRLESIS